MYVQAWQQQQRIAYLVSVMRLCKKILATEHPSLSAVVDEAIEVVEMPAVRVIVHVVVGVEMTSAHAGGLAEQVGLPTQYPLLNRYR